jgi:hypothetical protein
VFVAAESDSKEQANRIDTEERRKGGLGNLVSVLGFLCILLPPVMEIHSKAWKRRLSPKWREMEDQNLISVSRFLRLLRSSVLSGV